MWSFRGPCGGSRKQLSYPWFFVSQEFECEDWASLLDDLDGLPAAGLVAVDVLLSCAVVFDCDVLDVHGERTLAVIGIYTLLARSKLINVIKTYHRQPTVVFPQAF